MILLRSSAKPPVPCQLRHISREWEEVLHLGVRETYTKGTRFSFKDKQQGDFCYIRRGTLCSLHPTINGVDHITFFLSEGCLLRETYVITGYCETIPLHHCLTDVEIFRFDGALLLDTAFAARYPHLIRNCMYSLAVKVASYDAMVQTMGKGSALEKVSWYINALFDYYQCSTFAPGITQVDLTMLLGIHQSSISRAVLMLKEHNIISAFTKHQLIILDPQRLRQIADGQLSLRPEKHKRARHKP